MKKIPHKIFPKEKYPNFGMRGKKRSKESKRKISKGLKDAYQNGIRPKVFAGRQEHFKKGHNHREEIKKKISEGIKRFYQKKFLNGWKNKKEREMEEKEKLSGRKKPKQCEICGVMRKICFDHDHKTGKFRGWICNRCNIILGLAKDNAELLKSLSDYLLR